MPGVIGVSCGRLPWWGAGLWCLTSQESLDDDHRATAFGARLMDIVIFGIVAFSLNRRLARFRIKQAPDLADPVAANAIREEACVADAVEAGGENVDQETADELIRGQPHDVHPVSLFDPIVFAAEGHGVGISADQAVV